MKYLFLAIVGMIALSSCKTTQAYLFSTFREPQQDGLLLAGSTDGYHWKSLGGPFNTPGVGRDKVFRDPSIIEGPHGTFHMVWTCSWTNDKGFGYASSKDLIHWSPSQYIEVMKNEPTTINVWAPELFYDKKKKDFIIIWASTIPYRFPKGQEAEDNNHRLYYTTTKDFKTFSKSKLYFDPGYSVIDPFLLQRSSKDYVLVLKDNTRPERDVKVSFAHSPFGPFSKPSSTFTPHFSEGPTAIKVGRDYLIYFERYEAKKYGAVETKDFKTFTDISNKIILPKGQKHGTIFKVKYSVYKKLLKYQSQANK